jgi:hypothetical protein
MSTQRIDLRSLMKLGTAGRLFLAALAIVVLYGVVQFLSLALEARHNTQIRRHREARRELNNYREDYPPEYYERRMRELDAEAIELGITPARDR